MPGLVRLLVRKQMSFFVFVSLTQIYLKLNVGSKIDLLI